LRPVTDNADGQRIDSRGTLVLGVIGLDVHIIGLKLLAVAFEDAGYRVVNLGVTVTQEEFINAAIETNADAILVSSVYGHAELDCPGLREKCVEAGIGNIPLFIGGNLVVGNRDWNEIEAKFLAMGFDRAFRPGLMPSRAVQSVEAEMDRIRKERDIAENR
jgi:methylaspartate mutase sigma subunit